MGLTHERHAAATWLSAQPRQPLRGLGLPGHVPRDPGFCAGGLWTSTPRGCHELFLSDLPTGPSLRPRGCS